MQPTIITVKAEVVGTNKKRMPLVWIPATLIVGLLIAAIYLGGRIVTGHQAPPAAASAIEQPPAPQAPPAQPPAAEPVSAPPAVQPAQESVVNPEIKSEPTLPNELTSPHPLTTPHQGERYIQIGAFNQEATTRFVLNLRIKKMEPHIAPGPTPEILRVLIGPFDSLGSLDEKKAQLEREGFDTFVRQY
jgi:cell division septation protein DedD